MGALLAFAIGYLVGAQQGRDGINQTVAAWETIRKSPEFQALVASGAALAGNVVKEGLAQGRGPVATGVTSVITERAKDALLKRTSMRVVVG
ncbi:MAG: hypothetical protein NVSMB57_03940 [Actinomycetota bacterium]